MSDVADGAGGPGSVTRLLVLLAVAVGVFVVALGPVSDGDVYWHLAAGREMVRRHALLRVDPFTLSAAGRPWVDVHWLFQLAAFGVYAVGGLLGLTMVKATVVAGAAVGATSMAGRAGGPAARVSCAVVLVAFVFLARHLLPIRPVIVTLGFVTLFLAVLERARVESSLPAPRPRSAPLPVLLVLLVLPLAQIVWTNCQGLSALGPVIVFAYLMGALLDPGRGARTLSWRRPGTRLLAASLGLCVLGSCLTPYGLEGVRLPLRLFLRLVPGSTNVFSAAIAENVPPFVLERTAPEQVSHFRWVLGGMALAFAVARPRLPLVHGLLLAAFAGLALMANRNVLLFYWVAAPLTAIALGERATRAAPPTVTAAALGRRLGRALPGTRRLARSSLPVAVGAILLGELAVIGLAAARETAAGTPTPFHFPVESVRRLADLGERGPVFAPDQHGGYLDLMLPQMTPYIDTRLVLHTGPEYADYLALFAEPARFDALAARENFRAVILTTAYPDSYLGLIAHLADDPAWHLVYTDGFEVLFTRGGESLGLGRRSTVDEIARGLAERFGDRPDLHAAARLNLARLLVVLGQSGQAIHVLSSLDSRPAVQLRARAELASGDLAAAESLASILVDADARDVHSLTLLAEIAEARGQVDRALGWLRRSLVIDPYDAEARAMVDRLEHPHATGLRN